MRRAVRSSMSGMLSPLLQATRKQWLLTLPERQVLSYRAGQYQKVSKDDGLGVSCRWRCCSKVYPRGRVRFDRHAKNLGRR